MLALPLTPILHSFTPFSTSSCNHFRLHLDIELDHFESHDDLFIPAGIFDHESEAQKATFLRAVEAVNDDRTILTKSLVTTDINDYPHDDSFKASKKLCEMVQSSVAGIFGPTK